MQKEHNPPHLVNVKNNQSGLIALHCIFKIIAMISLLFKIIAMINYLTSFIVDVGKFVFILRSFIF